jgi:RNA polymerase sigma-70 factor, ECF subfamily
VTGPTPSAATVAFEAERPRLAALAYRMLGTPDDADDVVQDAWLRWAAADHEAIVEPAAWLTTVTTRIAIDRLRSARRRREVYVGPWLPEPLPVGGEDDPFAAAATAESLTLGFLTVLERLEPVERAVFLLHDVFGYPFADVAATVDRTETAARQIARRARERVQAERTRVDADPERAGELAGAFLGAVVEGDVDALRRLLTDDVVHLSDGGPHRRAARRPVVGADRVARLLVNLASRIQPGTQVDPVRVNGELGWYATVDGRPELVLVPSFRDGRVASVLAVLNPDKLARFHAAWLARSS